MNRILAIDIVQPGSKNDEIQQKDAGFRWGPRGTHTSRTLMLKDLRLLLDYCSPDAHRPDYLHAIQEQNCLGKRTTANRKITGQRLSELYALDSGVLLFQVMRECWYIDRNGQALLALLMALARDPLLRASASIIVQMQFGEELDRSQMNQILRRVVGDRLNESILQKVVINAASSWTQSGHLDGRSCKVRKRVMPTAMTTVFALVLGYLTGNRGQHYLKRFGQKYLMRLPTN